MAAKYRLQIVLDKRQKVKEDAEKNLADSQKALQKEKDIEQERIQDIEKAKKRKEDEKVEMNRKIMEGLWDVDKIKNGKLFLKSLDFEIKKAEDRLEEQRQKVKEAEAFVEQRRAELVEATKDYQAIEKHKENWQQQVKKEIEYKEQEEQEEIGNVLFLARKAKDQ
jgi:hypothetical protein